eukprot:8197918-Alexandrium_andersonii.AAC.1
MFRRCSALLGAFGRFRPKAESASRRLKAPKSVEQRLKAPCSTASKRIKAANASKAAFALHHA